MAKLFFTLALSLALSIALVSSQSQSDFISIDCGAPNEYTDDVTGINYTTDANYAQSGKSANISQAIIIRNSIARQYWNVRSFPDGKRNCYKLQPPKGKNQRYLIRASFVYGDYDGLKQFPDFDLYLGVNKWKTVNLSDSVSEIIHVLERDYLDVCLVKTGDSTPFISVLELRLLDNNTYVSQSGSLELYTRQNCGSQPTQTVRYDEDVFDRIWKPFNANNLNRISNSTQLPIVANSLKQPLVVMSTAVTPQTVNGSISFDFSSNQTDNEIPEHYLYLHFLELQNLTNSNQTREFNIYLNGIVWFGPFVPSSLSTTTIYSPRAISGMSESVLINRTENSTLPPLLNAFEIYTVKNLSDSETNQDDVEAISQIKMRYGLKRNSWQGDPCAPKNYVWSGLNCSYDGNDPPRIISLNLSSTGLRREISPFIAQLRMLKYLDLSNNNLSGNVPEILSDLSDLTVLNLKGNKLRGPIPPVLLERKRNGQLSLSVDPYLIENETSPSPSSPSSPTSEDAPPTKNLTTSSSDRNSFVKRKFAVSLLASIGFYLMFNNQFLS